MDDVRIRQILEKLCSGRITDEAASGYVLDVLRSVFSSDYLSSEDVISTLRFIVKLCESNEFIGDYFSNYTDIYNRYSVMAVSSGKINSRLDVIEYIEDNILAMTDIYCDGISKYGLMANMRNRERKYIIARYAVMYVLFKSVPFINISNTVICSRYEYSHTIKRHVINSIDSGSIYVDRRDVVMENEKTFINFVKKFSEDFYVKLRKMINFETKPKYFNDEG